MKIENWCPEIGEGVLYAPLLPIAAPRPKGQGGKVFDQSAEQAVNACTGHPSTLGQGGGLSAFTSPSIHSSNPEGGSLLAGHDILTAPRSILDQVGKFALLIKTPYPAVFSAPSGAVPRLRNRNTFFEEVRAP